MATIRLLHPEQRQGPDDAARRAVRAKPPDRSAAPGNGLWTGLALGRAGEASGAASGRIEHLPGGGEPLPASARSYFEPRFGADFGNVRVHRDRRAADMAEALQARAFTTGQDIVFGAGEYAPDRHDGRRLLAHELTHTLQQGTDTPAMQRTPKKADALAAPWSASGVKPILGMTPEGQTVLAALEAGQVNVEVCDEILATKMEIVIDDPSGKLSAEDAISGLLKGSVARKRVIQTPVAKPTYNGHSNKDTATIFIVKEGSNLDAAATLRHERMHIVAASGTSRSEEEKLIRAAVSSWRADMETALGLTDAEKAGGTLPSTDLTDAQREAKVDASKHYNPAIAKHGSVPNEYVVTVYVPRPINPQPYRGFVVASPLGAQPLP